jgi:hypothetical protein
VHVVTEESRGAAVQTTCAFHEAVAVGCDFRDVMIRTDCDRAQWPRMSISDALVVNRHIEEAGGAERFTGWLNLLEMSAKGLFPLVEAENRLE